MRKEFISEREGIAILVLFLMDGALILPTGYKAGKDIWIAILFASILGILISLVYSKILKFYPGKDIFDILEVLFGSVVGKAISLIYVWYAFHLSSLVFANFTQYIKTINLRNTNELTIVVFPAILCIWGLKIGIEGIGRFSNLVLIPLMVSIFIAIVLEIPKMDFEHLLPILENGFYPVFKGTFSIFDFPFAETVLFMGIANCFKDHKSISKIYIVSIIIVGIIMLLTKTTEIAVLGINNWNQQYFPSHAAVARISIADFFERMEIIVGLSYTISGLVKVSICMLVACKGISKILSFNDYRFLVTPIVILSIDFMFISNKTIIQITNWNAQILPYYSLPYKVLLPIMILIFALIKNKSKNPPLSN